MRRRGTTARFLQTGVAKPAQHPWPRVLHLTARGSQRKNQLHQLLAGLRAGSVSLCIFTTTKSFKWRVTSSTVIADYLNIDKNDRDRLMYPKRAMAVTLPVHMDDGSTKTFQGYRVQHHLTLGPTKGGTRFRPESLDGRNRRAGHVDELEMRAEQFALRRGERRRGLRSDQAFAQRARSRLAPLHAGDDSVRRAEDRHHGPGHGDERTGHGLVHGHLFGLPGLFA